MDQTLVCLEMHLIDSILLIEIKLKSYYRRAKFSKSLIFEEPNLFNDINGFDCIESKSNLCFLHLCWG